MIEVLYGMKGIRYRVINEQTGKVLIFSDHEVAIHYDLHGKIPLQREYNFHEVHYPIMDYPSNLEFMGRIFSSAEPRFCDGRYTLFEYELQAEYKSLPTQSVCWFVTTMDKIVMAAFALREQAMKYIHDKEERTWQD